MVFRVSLGVVGVKTASVWRGKRSTKRQGDRMYAW